MQVDTLKNIRISKMHGVLCYFFLRFMAKKIRNLMPRAL